jgi:3-hydroxybutyryl-CoA dehydrogenase
LVGRKAGEGFYTYADGKKQVPDEPAVPALRAGLTVWVSPQHGDGHARAVSLIKAMGADLAVTAKPPADALIVVTPYGQDVSTAVQSQGLDATRTVGLDTLFGVEDVKRRCIMVSPATSTEWRDAAHALFAKDGVPVSVIEDSPGFVAQRIVAAIVNVASDIAQQKIATPEDIDRAVTLGLGYPAGPLAMGDKLGVATIVEVLRNLLDVTGDPQRRAQLGLSLLAPSQSPSQP